MAKPLVDLTGNRYGRLTVVRKAEKAEVYGYNGRVMWLCKCDCGEETIVYGCSLTSGRTKSCGCLHSEVMRELHKNKRKKSE